MVQLCNSPTATASQPPGQPSGQILKGQYVGAFRSRKGKLKGLQLSTPAGEYPIRLPKYLRPILVRELTPGAFIQVWAYADDTAWRAVNVLPLPETEAASLQAAIAALPSEGKVSSPEASPRASVSATSSAAPRAKIQIQVCGKGKCCKQGGQDIWRRLQAEVSSDPTLQHLSVKTTGCLKACKKGPNVRLLPSGQLLHRVHPDTALDILAEYR